MTILIDLFDWSSPGFQLICLSNEVGFIQEIQSRDYFKHVGRVLLTNLSLAKVIDSKIDTIINWSKSSVIEFDRMNMITKKLSSKQTIGRIWTCDSWLFHVANVLRNVIGVTLRCRCCLTVLIGMNSSLSFFSQLFLHLYASYAWWDIFIKCDFHEEMDDQSISPIKMGRRGLFLELLRNEAVKVNFKANSSSCYGL